MDKKSNRINRGPIWILFLKEYKKAIFLSIISFLFFIFINRDVDIAGVSPGGYKAIVIFVLAMVLWTTNLIPLPITSLMIMGLLATYRVMDTKSIYSFFGNSSIFFIIGAFIISAGIRVSGLSKRMAYFVFGKYGKSPTSLVISIFLMGFFLSHIMPEHGVGALLFPIIIEIMEVIEVKKGDYYGKYLFFAMVWGCVLGGVVTYLGGARNPLAIGILSEMTGKNIPFLKWVGYSAPPIYLIAFGVIIFFSFKMNRLEGNEHVDLAKKVMENELEKLHKLTFREIKAAVILLITIFMWVFYNEKFGIANIAILSASLYFVLNVIFWDEANRNINWGVIFMYGGALAIGSALSKLGVLNWVVTNMLTKYNFSPAILLIILAVLSIVLTELISNSAVVVIFMPMAINIANQVGIPLEIVTIGIAIPSGLAFMLPISTPVVALIRDNQYLEVKDMIYTGIIIKFISIIVFLGFSFIYWKI